MTRQPQLDPEAIYVAADQRRRGLRISWNEVARQSGIASKDVFMRLGRGTVPHSHNLFLILLWVGRTDLRSFEKASR
ncbi:hypothetical protein GCM10010432_15570 [Catellatospora methionotrophica]